MDAVTIAERLAEVRRGVDEAARACGRDPSAVHLVAVGKTFPASAVREAYDAGHRDFGENYAQELRDKTKELPADVRWHFIGRIQTNKAKYLVGAYRVHAIESVEQAVAIASRRTEPLRCLVSVNTGGEETKGGVRPDDALGLCEALAGAPNVEVRGLMTLPPNREDPEDVAPFFQLLADLAAEGRRRGLPLDELSMGMSHDYPVAIRHGATWVRVGSAIFGARTPKA